jgi:hypothetical protein
MVFTAAFRPHMRAPCRDADRVRVMMGFPPRGWRAEKRKPMVPLPSPEAAAPRGAPHALKQRSGSACSFAAIWRSTGPAFARGRQKQAPPQVVSQLLAGPLSGPGGSPTAARVSGLRDRTRGAPHPIPPSRRLATAPLGGQGESRIRAARNAGISFSASYRRKPVSSSRQRREGKLDPGFCRGDASGCTSE